jgi:hypothetical protein
MNWLTSLWGSLPDGVKEGAKQTPAALMLAAALTAYMSGKWMSNAACQALRDSDQKETAELRASREEFKKIAYNCTGIVVERAQQSVAVNEQASEKAQTQRKVVATVKIPVTPLTSQEKADVVKPTDAEPATLNQSLKASNVVLKKNDLRQAEVTTAAPAKKPE